jgi:hypothetical protein
LLLTEVIAIAITIISDHQTRWRPDRTDEHSDTLLATALSLRFFPPTAPHHTDSLCSSVQSVVCRYAVERLIGPGGRFAYSRARTTVERVRDDRLAHVHHHHWTDDTAHCGAVAANCFAHCCFFLDTVVLSFFGEDVFVFFLLLSCCLYFFHNSVGDSGSGNHCHQFTVISLVMSHDIDWRQSLHIKHVWTWYKTCSNTTQHTHTT